MSWWFSKKIPGRYYLSYIPMNFACSKSTIEDTRERCEICSKLTAKKAKTTLERPLISFTGTTS